MISVQDSQQKYITVLCEDNGSWVESNKQKHELYHHPIQETAGLGLPNSDSNAAFRALYTLSKSGIASLGFMPAKFLIGLTKNPEDG